MPKTSTPEKNRGVPPNEPEQKIEAPANEFCSMNNSLAYSYACFGLNIFDLYSQEQLAALVKDPMGNNAILRELSLILYGMNGSYTHSTDYMVAMPTLDKVVVSYGKDKKKCKLGEELMTATLRRIKDKEIVRDALFRGIVEGAYYGYFETKKRRNSRKKFMSDFDVQGINEINDADMNAAVISLPADYTQIVGMKNSSYVIAFDLNYFVNGDMESIERKLQKMPQEIRDAYKRWNEGGKTAGNWVVLDNSRTIVHKIRSKREEKYGRPLVLAAISDILYGDYFVQTKKKVLDEINNRIVYMTFPEGKDKGTSALTKQQQQQQHEAVKGAVFKKNERGGTSFFSVAAGTKISAIDTQNTDIFDDKYEASLNDRISRGLGVAGSLLDGVGGGSYSAQTQNLELITAQLFQWVEQIQDELNKCINAHIIRDSKNRVECKYLRITHANKDKMVGYAKDLYLQGRGPLSLWASACGVEPDVFFALLDREIEKGVDNYPVHPTSFNSSGGDNKGGRPTTDNPTDTTVANRAAGGNAMPSPSD